MKLHEMIFVRHDPKEHGIHMDDNWTITHEGFMGPDKRFEVVPKRNAIVLTLEELYEVWKGGAAEQCTKPIPLTNLQENVPGFEKFVHSKGLRFGPIPS